jgi:hypothetical protein
VNLLDAQETATVTAGQQTPPITVPGTAAKVFIAQSQLLALDPVVASVTPAHDADGVGAAVPILVHFSQPMDTRSVESAFATMPAVTGAFAWSTEGDTMTFTPGGVGFPAQNVVSVRIGATARAATAGAPLYAAFESRFKTGTAAQPAPAAPSTK